MKPLSKLAAAATVATSLLALGAPLAMAQQAQSEAGLRASVVSEARANGITIADPQALTMAQLTELSDVLNSGDRQKASEVETILNARHETALLDRSAAADPGLRDSLVSEAAANGLDIANPDQLTVAELIRMSDILNSDSQDKAAALRAVLGRTDMDRASDPSTAGLRDSVVSEAAANGVTIANPGSLTDEQLAELGNILNSGNRDKPAAIRAVIGRG
ncbi:hypothetical protein [Oceaniglobus roseus]|uniref:hypothetical protein n=1 Tax=Oceaniglobus roseus TaxID=1737570 RepID=UPI000C7EE06B|nr:hypothetical protein [Kandeliimicrobium roseum]